MKRRIALVVAASMMITSVPVNSLAAQEEGMVIADDVIVEEVMDNSFEVCEISEEVQPEKNEDIFIEGIELVEEESSLAAANEFQSAELIDDTQDEYTKTVLSDPGEDVSLNVGDFFSDLTGFTFIWSYFDADFNYHTLECTDSIYVIENISSSGEYHCLVTDWSTGNGESVTVTFNVTVDSGLVPGGETSPRTINVVKGAKITLDPDLDVKDGTELTYSWDVYGDAGKIDTIINNGPLEITCDMDYMYYLTVSDQYGNKRYIQFYVFANDPYLSLDYSVESRKLIKPGEYATLQVIVDTNCLNKEDIQYQWYSLEYNYEENKEIEHLIDGATESSYTSNYTGEYLCRVTLDGFEPLEQRLSIGYSEYPDICYDYSPYGYLVPGGTVTLEVKEVTHNYVGDVTPKYQWYNREVIENPWKEILTPIEGATDSTYETDKTGSYTCRISLLSDYRDATYDVTYIPGFEVNRKMQNFTLDAGTAVSLVPKITVKEGYNITYEWSGFEGTEAEPGQPLTDIENPAAEQITVICNDNRVYYCKVSDGYGNEETLRFNIQVIKPDIHEHEFGYFEAKAATCKETGNYEYWYCNGCEKYYADEAATVETTLEALTLSVTEDHTWITLVDKAPTCGSTGLQHQECIVCETSMPSTEMPATGNHSYGSYTVTTAPTVIKTGWQTAKCVNCTATTGKTVAKLPATVKLTNTKLNLQLKKSATLTSLVTGLAKGDSIKSWKSSDPAVATITNAGKVTAKKAGKSNVTVTLASGKTATIALTVQKAAVATTKVSVASTNVTLAVGKSQTLKPVIEPITSLQKATYKTSNKKIVTVASNGKITAKKPGTATITVTSGKKSVKVKVTVPAPALKAITKVPAAKTLKKGKNFTIKPVLSPAGATDKIIYSSSDTSVATVNAKGKVVAKKKAGTAVITVKAGKFKVTCKVTVK